MKAILVINDDTPQAEHAAKFALNIAHKMQTAVLLANTVPVKKITERVLAGLNNEYYEDQENKGSKQLNLNNKDIKGFQPPISEVDISDFDAAGLVQMIRERDILMIVKGMPDTSGVTNKLNIHAVLNRVHCPLLLVPETWKIKTIERLVYIADLRFCRTLMVNYLANIAKKCDATLSVAHLSAKGIPDMEENYANSIFKEQVVDRLTYKNLYFNNIKEKDLKKALDVIINGLHNDILAFVNHRFHFEEILGRYLTDVLPENITVPLLIFPY